MFEEIPLLVRAEENPILSKKDISYNAALIFNAGVIKYHGTYYMVFRNDYLGYPPINKVGIGGVNLGVARSKDGIHWIPNDKPAFEMHDDEIERMYDPRLTVIDDEIYICFAVDTKHGVRGGIGKVIGDFERVEVISMSVPDNRNMVLFPEKINGMYVRLERPFPVYSRGGDYFDIWMSDSADLKYWGNSKLVLGAEKVPYCNNKIGPAAPPIKTEKGWLTTFHAVELDPNRGKNGWEEKWQKIYYAGIMLLDLKDPSKVIGFSKLPILAPKAPYEREGYRNDVIFPGGMILEDDGEVKIYYGAADTVECLATAKLDDLINLCLKK
ncbi:MAG: glycoside hydrolase family 130 protein [Bacilli bacterium]|nr:glycoside hydrolase family 130 protein [Bacilli bacterium]